MKQVTDINGASVLPHYIRNYVDRVNADGGTAENLQALQDGGGSLCIISSGKKVGKIHALNPVNGTGDSAFLRASEATYIDKDGVMQTAVVDEPRIDWSDGVAKFLLEEESENIVEYSEDFQNFWIKQYLTPLNKTTMQENTSNTHHIFYQSKGSLAAGIYTQSAVVEQNVGNRYLFFQLAVNSASERYGIIVDLLNGNVTDINSLGSPLNTSYSVKKIADTNKYKVSVTIEHTSGTIYPGMGFSDSPTPIYNSMIQPTYQGDGTSSIKVHYMQLEQNTEATSYIPTNEAPVIRAADVPQPIDVPTGVIKIIEYFADGSINEITTIPTTYTLPNGLTKLKMI